MSEFPGSVEDGSVRAFKGVLELMSELFFASLEPGNNYVTRPIILNTALYYALGYAQGNYINKPMNKRAKKQNPSYVEDTSDIAANLYVSPAQPIGNIRYTSELANARSDDYIQSNRPAKQMNSPTGKIGTRKQIQPGARFRFYVLAFDGNEPDMPPYIRVGKKRSKSLIEWKEVPVSADSGEFTMNHPVLVDDLAEMPVGDISFRRMQPFDVIERGRFTGQHLVLHDKTPTDSVVFPADVRFLRRRRV